MGICLSCCVPTIKGEQITRKDNDEARNQVIKEIISSEETYVRGLRNVVSVFLSPIELQGILKDSEVQAIFSNIRSLAEFHEMFLNDLKKQDANIPTVFNQYADFFRMYTDYINTYDKCINTVDDLATTNRKFRAFLDQARKEGHDLMSHLILPIQRIPRYEMLLREVRKFTPKSHADFRTLEFAFYKIKKVAQYINEQKREAENKTKCLEIQSKIVGRKGSLVKPDRHLIKEGFLKLPSSNMLGMASSKDVIAYLFNNLFMWTAPNDKFVGDMELKGMEVEENKQENSDKKAFQFTVRSDVEEIEDVIFICLSESERQEWILKLKSTIEINLSGGAWW